jgi:hypothetical protein
MQVYRTALFAGAALAAPFITISAQQPAGPVIQVEAMRETLLHLFEQHKQMDVEYTRAIPDSALRWAPTEGVRDFAEQMRHIILDHGLMIGRAVVGEEPALGDRSVFLNDKAQLEESVIATYDWVLGTLRSLPAEDFLADTELFGRQLKKWQIYYWTIQHADWTRGQLVPYYRMNGVAPPSWRSY